jgi:diguanylate cyclase (GGDEF)-like protein
LSILIVDDGDDTREALRALLTARGYRGLCTAACGQEALELLSDGAAGIDVVLTDVNMPGLSGIDVCHQIKTTPHLHDIQVLVLTGQPDEEVLEQAFAAGACDFISKPVRPNDLLARVRAAVNLKRELDQRRARERELVEVTERLKRVNEKLQRLSMRDELTGIANRRYFNWLISQEWARAAREVLPLSLILIDIDYFKDFNDHYGHPRGDECLTKVADTLHGLARRPGDCVARYGGEEFVVLLAHTETHGAAAVAERLRAGVEALGLDHARSKAHNRVTISLGVACTIPGRSGTPEALLAAADEAVYRAKAEGRNCVRISPGVPDAPLPGLGPPAPLPHGLHV